jgi:signal transduction histidine kinase
VLNLHITQIFQNIHEDLILKNILSMTQLESNIHLPHVQLKTGKNQLIHTQIFVTPLYDESFHQTGISLVIQDLTKLKTKENEMKKMESFHLLGEMAASIGHEIRNPMTTVKGFLQIMLKEAELERYTNYLKIMIQELDRANLIITEYLSLAKDKPRQFKIENINEIIETLYPLLQATALINNHTITLSLEPIPHILLDESEIKQLIINLVKNGLEAMEVDKILTISTQMRGDDIILTIQDQGTGIPFELLDKIGTPFFSTKERGTGLGISICYTIVKNHNGTMNISSNSKGTMIEVCFKPLSSIAPLFN